MSNTSPHARSCLLAGHLRGLGRSVAATALALLLAAPQLADAASLDGLAVEVTSASEPVLCAEKDNVTLNLASPSVRGFRVEAAHPAYIGTLQCDSFAADWTACDMSADPMVKSEVKTPTRRTLYEEPDIWVVGWTMPTYWRAATATVRTACRSKSPSASRAAAMLAGSPVTFA